MVELFLVDCLKVQQGVQSGFVHNESLALVYQVAAVLPIHLVINQIQKLNELHRKLERHSGLNIELLVVEWLTGFILN